MFEQEQMQDDRVRFGCISCKRTRRMAALDAAAEKTMEQVFTTAFDLIQEEGRRMGVTVPEALREKMLKWGRKQSIFAEDPDILTVIAARNRLD